MAKNKLNLLKSKPKLHMRIHNCIIFMHDGAPCHEARWRKNSWSEKYPNLVVARKQSGYESNRKLVDLMKNKVLEKHPSNLDAFQTAIKKNLSRLLLQTD